MPPHPKFSKEDITKAALEIVRMESFDSLTARALGKKLGSSACPIFTVFANMEEVQQSVMTAIRGVYKEYIDRGLLENPAFKGVGTQYILFAIQEPKLFQILFMRELPAAPDIDHILPEIDESYLRILTSITTEYQLTNEDAQRLYQHLWIYTHGIASLCATKMCRFTGEEISRMLTEVFISLLKETKGRKNYD